MIANSHANPISSPLRPLILFFIFQAIKKHRYREKKKTEKRKKQKKEKKAKEINQQGL
jgi:hypothetical protein